MGGKFLILTPPISSEFQLFCGGLGAVGRSGSEVGLAADKMWFSAALWELLGDDSGALSSSFNPLTSVIGLTGLGLVIGIADLVTVREAIALARAR